MSAGAQKLKSRIKSAKNIAQITKAMEMVSAAKMRKAQERALQSKPYAEALETYLRMLGVRSGNDLSHPLLQTRAEPKKALIVVMTSDKGLAGSFHSNLFRRVASLERKLKARGLDCAYVAMGRKGRDFLRYTKRELAAVFDTSGDKPTTAALRPMVEYVRSEFSTQLVDEVYVVHAEFVSTLVQRPTVLQLLPFKVNTVISNEREKSPEVSAPVGGSLAMARDDGRGDEKVSAHVPLFEPNRDELLNTFLPFAIEYLVYKAVLQSLASEHSARMIAMKNANDNAKEIGKELLLAFNQIRQATITQQINEISSASMATYQ